ncbi:hypothetical protein [Chryseobacterium sp. S90]|uniref:hypothetical protein n=1 Tax=Chryseobacterium sp. S90 TaxID=3395373 RepID=UPI0039BCABF1
MEEYKKTLEDEIDWKMIDQLHNATNNFSSSSLEFKKIYFVLLGILTPIIFKLANNKFDISLLITPLCLSIFFWILDIITYYFQEDLRARMKDHFKELKKRSSTIPENNEEYTLENNRTPKSRLYRSFFNASSMFYPIIIGFDTILIIFHYAGAF